MQKSFIIDKMSLGFELWWWSIGQRARLLFQRSEFQPQWRLQFFSVKFMFQKTENKQKWGRNWTIQHVLLGFLIVVKRCSVFTPLNLSPTEPAKMTDIEICDSSNFPLSLWLTFRNSHQTTFSRPILCATSPVKSKQINRFLRLRKILPTKL